MNLREEVEAFESWVNELDVNLNHLEIIHEHVDS